MINSAGQVVYKGKISHSSGSSKQLLKFDVLLPAGIYEVQLANGDEIKTIPVLFK